MRLGALAAVIALVMLPARAETVMALHGSDVPGATRILWIGNSHTARWGVAAIVARMAEAAGRGPVSIRTLTRGGAGLSDTAAEAAPFLSESWDAIVLQDWSWNAIAREDRLTAALDAILPRAEPVVIAENWAYSPTNGYYRANPGMTPDAVQARIDALFAGFPARYGASIAPAGRAIRRGEAMGLALVSPDGNHLTEAGAALMAATIYLALFGTLPEPAPDSAPDSAPDPALIEAPWRP